jgi:quercetin dioxygenase-like cupin family protein
MEASSIPQVKISKSGNEFKILNVTGTKGSAMDTHLSTGEAILSVFRGEAVLKLGEKEMHLLPGELVIIPAEEPHTLSILNDFEANVIMAIDSQIKFLNKQ